MHTKERLTGAIILVVLVVLVVPELLTGPRRARTPEVETAVEGAPMRSYTIELGDRSAAKPAQPRNHAPPNPSNSPVQSQPAPRVDLDAVVPRDESEKQPVPPQVAVVRPAPEPPPVTGWSIQVGSFASRQNADRLTNELARRGFRSFVKEGTGGGRKLYRVRVGPERDRDAARALADRLKAAGSPGAIVPHP